MEYEWHINWKTRQEKIMLHPLPTPANGKPQSSGKQQSTPTSQGPVFQYLLSLLSYDYEAIVSALPADLEPFHKTRFEKALKAQHKEFYHYYQNFLAIGVTKNQPTSPAHALEGARLLTGKLVFLQQYARQAAQDARYGSRDIYNHFAQDILREPLQPEHLINEAAYRKDSRITRAEKTLDISDPNVLRKYFDVKMMVYKEYASQTVVRAPSLISFMASAYGIALQNKVLIKYCANCKRAFIPSSRTDEIYCSNPSPQNCTLTCKEYGSQKLWYEKMKDDEVAHLARNIYMAKQNKARRYRQDPELAPIYQHEFDQYRTNYKQWKKQLKEGEQTQADYHNWLLGQR